MRVMKSLHPKGFLSFGSDSESIEFEDLNVLIGPNSSGKSNLVAALDVLRSAPGDLVGRLTASGGVRTESAGNFPR